jgi:hypothetical protein
MATLLSYCSLIRSKNAGPFTLTFDLMCKDQERYDALVDSGAVNRELVAQLYGCEPDVVTLVHHPRALAIKISMPRPQVQGDLRDSDCYAGQQYAPLMDLQIPGAPST